MAAKLQVLCLHGSRQDGEIFSQRITQLARKLQDIAELHFVDAPHELPLEEGQSIAMRAWWRHPSIDHTDERTAASTSSTATAGNSSTGAETAVTAAHELYDSRMIPDWQASLAHLKYVWQAHGGFDAILGFSNGAAAGMLLACHVACQPAAWPGRRLKCVVLASGYVPEPLHALVPPEVQIDLVPEVPDGTSEEATDATATVLVSQLHTPLKLASLHLYSARDKAVQAHQSRALSRQFEASKRQVLEHDLAQMITELFKVAPMSRIGCVPQKAHHCEAVLDFLSWFEPDVQPPSSTAAYASSSPIASNSARAAFERQQLLQEVIPHGSNGMQEVTPAGDGACDHDNDGCAASAEQSEEMEALQAIFDAAYQQFSRHPPKFCISLKDPSLCSTEGEDSVGMATDGPASAAFSLVFTLPEGYPQASTPPTITLHGPVLSTDARVKGLHQHLQALALQELEATGSGCCYQLVEAAREWLDAQLPSNFLAQAALPGSVQLQPEIEEPAAPWWEAEEADGVLIREAIETASCTHWSHFYGGQTVSSNTSTAGTGVSDITTGSDMSEAGNTKGGRWDYIIGLVGKPSAGKSSLFNALTCALSEGQGAKVAAQPFTTIAPNVDRGWVVVPDPCRACGLQPRDCKPTHGHALAFDPSSAPSCYANTGPLTRWLKQLPWAAEACWRRVPVLIKDVAGLVPGAYAGRGRGNAFLNDLCDADVLIHVVDASGSTDSEGRPAQPGEGADPLDDIGWVREEIHRWVYDNVRRKWGVVRRRPCRLPDLFTGYHASRALIHEVLERVGLPASVLASDQASPLLTSWQEADLHKLVATFLMARFPILLALNKSDIPAAGAHIRRVRAALPHEPAVPVSAACERWLAAAAHDGYVMYQAASHTADVVPSCQDPAVALRVAEINKRVLGQFGSTGTLLAVATAMAMRPPRVVFPVADCTTCVAIASKGVASATGVMLGSEDAKARAAEGTSPSVLRDTLLLKPGSTPADVFKVLKKPPWQLLEGEFVRAECRVLAPAPLASDGMAAGMSSAQKHVLKKDDALTGAQCVLRIMTNRKAAGWQK